MAEKMVCKELHLPLKLLQKVVKKVERCGYASFNEYIRRLMHEDLDKYEGKREAEKWVL